MESIDLIRFLVMFTYVSFKSNEKSRINEKNLGCMLF